MMKKQIRKCLSYVLSFSMVFMSSNSWALSSTDANHNYQARTQFSSTDAKISDNMWITHLFTNWKIRHYHLENEYGFTRIKYTYKSIGSVLRSTGGDQSLTIKRKTEQARRDASFLSGGRNPLSIIGEVNRDSPGPDMARRAADDLNKMTRMNMTYFIQDQLNLAYKYGPGLRELLDANKFDEAFRYAHQHGLVILLIQPAGLAAIGVTAFTKERMIDFYKAGGRNYTIAKSDGMPYEGYEWMDNKDMPQRAMQNFNESEFNQIPAYAYFNKYFPQPDQSLGSRILGAVVGIALSVVTAGIGSAVTSGIINAVGQGVTVGASGAITAGTIAGVNIAAGSIGGTILSVASNAMAGAIVGTVRGQSFSDALTSGLIGGAVGATLSGGFVEGINPVSGINTAVQGVLGDGIASQYVSGVITGTATSALLNGGDFDAAFAGAATGVVTSMIANNIREEMRQQNNIVEESGSASGGLDFNISEQAAELIDQGFQEHSNQLVQEAVAQQDLEIQQNAQANLDTQAAAQQSAYEQNLAQQMQDRNIASLNAAIAQGAYMDNLTQTLIANQASIDSFVNPMNGAYGDIGNFINSGSFFGSGSLEVSIPASAGFNPSNLTAAAALLNMPFTPLEYLGSGRNSHVYRLPDGSVAKILHGSESLANEAADIITETMDDLRNLMNNGNIITNATSQAGVINQPFVGGYRIDDLPSHIQHTARTNRAAAIADAVSSFGNEYFGERIRPGETVPMAQTNHNGHIFIDENPANFRYNADGTIRHWFDPVGYTTSANAMSSEHDRLIRNVPDIYHNTNFSRFANVGGALLGVAEVANIAGYYSNEMLPGAYDNYNSAVDNFNNASGVYEQALAAQLLGQSSQTVASLEALSAFHDVANPVLQPVGEVLSYVDPSQYTYDFTTGVIDHTEALGMQSFPNAVAELVHGVTHHTEGSDSFFQNYLDLWSSVSNTISGGAHYLYTGVTNHIEAGSAAYENGDFNNNVNDPSTFENIGGP